MLATTFLPKQAISFTRGAALASLISLFASGLCAEEVQLTWSDNSDNEDGFNIERSAGDGAFELLAQTGADVESYVDSTAEPGVAYNYRVNAFNAFGVSGYTNVAPHYINVAPSITELAAVEVGENETASDLAFSIEDFEAAAEDLFVTVSSSNTDLIDADGFLLEGLGRDRTLSLSPKVDASGEATITVSVSDGEDVSRSQFLFTVNAFLFPSVSVGIDTIGSTPRVGEPFTLSSEVSDSSLVSTVSYYVNGELLGEATSAPYEFSTSIALEGAFELSAVAKIVGRSETVTDASEILVGPPPSSSDIVARLRSALLGSESDPEMASYDLAADEFYLENEEGVIDGAADSHRYFFVRASGDFSISANLRELGSASSDSVGGLMLRSSLIGKAMQTSFLRGISGSLELRFRETYGGTTRIVGGFAEGGSWLRIDRVGTKISYYSKADAAGAWYLAHEHEFAFGNTVFLGFAVAAGPTSGLATASFTQARFQGEILTLGSDAVRPGIPSGLVISGISP